ncbi:MAG: nitrate reductase [bacterium]
MYEFARGPLVWMAFIIFIGGSNYRVVSTIRHAHKDKVVLPYMRWRYGLRSILHWTVPFAAKNMRMRPAFVVLSFAFHICLFLVPLFTLGHIVMWEQSLGVSLWALPNSLSKVMTFIVIIGALSFLMRRLADPTVRFVSTAGDFILIALVVAPFITGLMAYYQLFNYQTVITVHMWFGAIWLAMIPFTRIAHMLYFPMTRAYMGCEFGFVRNARDW